MPAISKHFLKIPESKYFRFADQEGKLTDYTYHHLKCSHLKNVKAILSSLTTEKVSCLSLALQAQQQHKPTNENKGIVWRVSLCPLKLEKNIQFILMLQDSVPVSSFQEAACDWPDWVYVSLLCSYSIMLRAFILTLQTFWLLKFVKWQTWKLM